VNYPLARIVVYGLPAPQGSKRHVGHGIMVESSKRLKPWRDSVTAKAIDTFGVAPLLDEPIVAEMVFTFARPRSHYRTGANSHLLRDGAPARPQGAPDVSKLVRSTEDALTGAGVWRDDARIVEYKRVAKVWADEDPDALHVPGAVIRVWTYAGYGATLAMVGSGDASD
jgi:Holliday junction resolvase RusA-like endonuclease